MLSKPERDPTDIMHSSGAAKSSEMFHRLEPDCKATMHLLLASRVHRVCLLERPRDSFMARSVCSRLAYMLAQMAAKGS